MISTLWVVVCAVTGQQRIVHTCWLLWCVWRVDGPSVSLPPNGTLDPRRVPWHFIEQLWPFNCALITFMSRGRQQPQNNPPSFMNSPLGHCQSRPSPGTLAAPTTPPAGPADFSIAMVLSAEASVSFHMSAMLAQNRGPSPSWVFWRKVNVGEASRIDFEMVNRQSMSAPINSAWTTEKAANFLWQVGLGGSRMGVLSSQRLPSLEMLHCTHFLFQSRGNNAAVEGTTSQKWIFWRLTDWRGVSWLKAVM